MASPMTAMKGGPAGAVASVLSALVTKGTITQAQADAISKKFDEVRAAKEAERAAKKAAHPDKAGKHGKGPKAPRP